MRSLLESKYLLVFAPAALLFSVTLGLATCTPQAATPASTGNQGGFQIPLGGDAVVGTDTVGGEGKVFCAPGATQLCWCTPSAQGVQQCREDASGWRPCMCTFSDATSLDASSDATSISDVNAGLDAAADAALSDVKTDIKADAKSDAKTDTKSDVKDAAADNSGSDVVGPDGCSEAAKKLYVFTDQGDLLTFNPLSSVLSFIGPLNCPAASGAKPFALTVDRKATLWVTYTSGELFQASSADGSCLATSWQVGQDGFGVMSPAFVSSSAGSLDETLYVASIPGNQLASIDPSALTISKVGPIAVTPGAPDLAGTGQGELWGFFPTTVPPSIGQIEKTSGAVPGTYKLLELNMASVTVSAFTHWGGKFWLFIKNDADTYSSVFTLDAGDGSYGLAKASLGYVIAGAGSSTCAPLSMPTP